MIEPIGDLIALDPSIRSSGVAHFRGGILVSADRIVVAPVDEPIAARCMRMAHAVAVWICGHNAEPHTLVIEWPQVYRAVKSPGDPNDLIGLAGVGMAVAGVLSMAVAARNLSLRVLSPTPAEWAGQIPKATRGNAKASPRALRILSRLNAEERLAVPVSHDAIDAVGLGLWSLGRTEPRRVFAGSV